MAFTYFAGNAIINHFERGSAVGTTSGYVVLFTADPTRDGVFTDEVTGGSYARQPVGASAPDLAASSNAAPVTFADMPAVTITHVGIATADTGGNLIRYGALPSPREVPAGETLTFPAGEIDLIVT